MPDTTDSPPKLMRRHLAVVHPERPALLLEREADGALRLPYLDEPDGDPRQVAGIAGALGPAFPLASLGELSYVWLETDQGENGVVSEYLMLCEPLPGVDFAAPAGHEWSSEESVVDLRAEHATALTELLRWLRGIAEPDQESQLDRLPPHCLPGATATLARALSTGVPELSGQLGTGAKQLQAWVLSNVWLGPDTVVKVTTPLWPQEPAVTARLHALAPSMVPEVLAHGTLNVPRASVPAPWMVTRRYAYAHSDSEPTSLEVLGTLAQLQARAANKSTELTYAGVPTRGPNEVMADLPVLWEEAALAGLAPDKVARLAELEASLRQGLEQLAAVAPPLLTHGDLHKGNVLITAALTSGSAPNPPAPATTRLVIFDWTDAAFAWPGVDLPTLAPYGLSRAVQPAELGRLKIEYLQAVRAALQDQRQAQLLQSIEASLDLGTQLALVYHAVTYAHIIRSVPRRQKPFVGTRFLVRAVTELLERLP